MPETVATRALRAYGARELDWQGLVMRLRGAGLRKVRAPNRGTLFRTEAWLAAEDDVFAPTQAGTWEEVDDALLVHGWLTAEEHGRLRTELGAG